MKAWVGDSNEIINEENYVSTEYGPYSQKNSRLSGFCVNCTELSTALKGDEFLFQLEDFKLFKKDPVQQVLSIRN